MSNSPTVLGIAAAGGPQSNVHAEMYLDVDLGDGWTARYRLRDQDGMLNVAEVHAFHGPKRSRQQRELELRDLVWNGRGDVPAGGLTKDRLRSVPLGPSIVAVAVKQMRAWPPELRRLMGAFGKSEAPKRAGPRARGERFYAELSAHYVDAYRQDPRRPVALLAASLGWKRDQVRDALHDARRAGMLTKGGRGLAGGDLTAKAKKLLRTRKGKR